jgi:hypothetical protein
LPGLRGIAGQKISDISRPSSYQKRRLRNLAYGTSISTVGAGEKSWRRVKLTPFRRAKMTPQGGSGGMSGRRGRGVLKEFKPEIHRLLAEDPRCPGCGSVSCWSRWGARRARRSSMATCPRSGRCSHGRSGRSSGRSVDPGEVRRFDMWQPATRCRTKRTLLGELRVRLERDDLQDFQVMARPGLEPGTPRFSVVCSTS